MSWTNGLPQKRLKMDILYGIRRARILFQIFNFILYFLQAASASPLILATSGTEFENCVLNIRYVEHYGILEGKSPTVLWCMSGSYLKRWKYCWDMYLKLNAMLNQAKAKMNTRMKLNEIYSLVNSYKSSAKVGNIRVCHLRTTCEAAKFMKLTFNVSNICKRQSQRLLLLYDIYV